jgi:outer membrane protein
MNNSKIINKIRYKASIMYRLNKNIKYFSGQAAATIFLLLLVTGKGVGQDINKPSAASTDEWNAKKISLSDAIQLSLQNNKQLKLSYAKIAEAKANYHQAKNNHLPDLKASGAYLRVNNPTVSLKVKLGGSSSGGSSSGSPVTVDQADYAFATLSMPIFAGFTIKYGEESAKFLEQAAKLDAENEKEEVLENTISAYGNLYKALKTIELVKTNMTQQVQRVKDFADLEKNGIIAKNDLLKAQLQQSNIELTELDAENNYNIACINMSLMLGLPEETKLIPDSAAFGDDNFPGSMVQWEDAAMKNRKDVAALGYREQAANSSIKATKGEYYPGIAVTGGYVALDVPNVLTVTNALNIGLGLQYNFGSIWKTGAKVEGAKARLQEIQVNEGILTDQIHIQVSQAYENYLLSKRKTDVYVKAIEQANENYRITKNKFVNNLVTTTELLEADVAQLQASIDYNISKADAIIAYKKLQQTAGTLSQEYSSKGKIIY